MSSILPGKNRAGGHAREARIREGARSIAQRVFGREREYASRKEYAERVMTVGLANTYRLGPWL
jgi:hypothetical protein